MPKPVPPPVEITAGTITPNDSLAIFSGTRRTPRYVRVRRITGGDPVTITLADGPAVTLPSRQTIKVAPRSGTR